jgi:hypothetical protein
LLSIRDELNDISGPLAVIAPPDATGPVDEITLPLKVRPLPTKVPPMIPRAPPYALEDEELAPSCVTRFPTKRVLLHHTLEVLYMPPPPAETVVAADLPRTQTPLFDMVLERRVSGVLETCIPPPNACLLVALWFARIQLPVIDAFRML